MFFSLALFSQNSKPSIFLKSGAITPAPNISIAYIDSFNIKLNRTGGKAFALLHFERIPNEQDRKTLFSSGIVLLDYILENAYTVSITGQISLGALQLTNARALLTLSPQQKMDERLAKENFPEWSVKVAGTIDVWISFPKTYAASGVIQLLKENNFQVITTDLQGYRIIGVRVAKSKIEELASFPFVEYVQPVPRPDHELNQSNRNGSRATVLNASVDNGGKNLNGEGIVIGVGDNTTAQPHIDFYSRLINRNTTTGAAHGIHVAGIAAGGGIVNELYRGYAPKATIIDASFSRILQNAPVYVKDHGMVLTNNSYGGGDSFGEYDMTSRFLDQQALDLTELLNVFAAGNSGFSSYPSFPSGFHTVLGAYQSAKNVLCVGNTTDSGLIITASSKGPVSDGRLKPEISAMGTGVISTWPTNSYIPNTGTSMSAPAVTGGLALLYQRYRQLKGGANPKSGLMKAMVCNG
ncbi:MAG: S8 family serine peptidase, partial [Chitinophagaceae bacterium]